MYPELFSFSTPEFLRFLLPETLHIYSYGFSIAVGAALSFVLVRLETKKQFNTPIEKVVDLCIIVIIAAVVGGKFFIFFEKPAYYLSNPGNMLKNLGNGFVFFGSLIFVIPSVLIYLKKQKIPILPMIDVLAVVACVLHSFGRLGCLLAGCCYGKPYDGIFAITFTHEKCLAHPLNTPLHPTQIYSIMLLLSILVVLLVIKKVKQFDGQIAMLYVMLYTFGRSIIEIFRGDEDRGYLIDGFVSNSQFIALVLILIVGYFYRKEHIKYKLKQRSRKK